jgi:hypothetical protein
MTISEQIRLDQEAALQTIRRVAESLPGFTFAEELVTLDGEAGAPDACNIERPLTPTVRVSGGQR